MNEGSARQQIVESIKANNNILVTVSASPSVDELSAALGLTMLLNGLDKRATAVVSGELPPAITFLDPEKTFESSVDSLRDFIIALDKEKADHLRYKVDGDVVKIFITPYRTTLSNKDLEFTQGDYNVELVLALGVKDQDHLDKALSAHGRILHDATVATVSVGTEPSKLGSIDWRDGAASSLCEMLVGVAEALKTDKPVLDEQIATAFLTGIVSATDRFSNDLTSSRVMTMAAQLMAAGANQQLIAAKLEAANEIGPNSANSTPSSLRSGEQAPSEQNTASNDGDETDLSIERSAKKRPKNKQKQHQQAPKVVAEPKAQSTEQKEQSDSDTPRSVGGQTPHAPAPIDVPQSEQDEATLASQLAEVATPVLPPSLDDVERELREAAQAEMIEPAPQTSEPSLPAIDTAMPGFEVLDAPAPQAAAVSEAAALAEPVAAISSHKAGGYVNSVTPPSPIIPSGESSSNPTDQAQQQNVTFDPFSQPLSPLVATVAPVMPMSAPAEAAVETAAPIAPFPASSAQLPSIGEAPAMSFEAIPPLPSQADLPPLPPMPDFSTLPPPPPLPVFDQVMPATNIFADQPAPFPGPQTPPPPAEPPVPGQFRIPGQ